MSPASLSPETWLHFLLTPTASSLTCKGALVSQSGSLHCWDVTESRWLPLKPTEKQSWTNSIFSGQEKLTHPTTYSKSKERNETTTVQTGKALLYETAGRTGCGTGRRAHLRAGRPRAAIEGLRVQALACGAGLWATVPGPQAPGLWWWLSGRRSTREQLPVSGHGNGLGRSRRVKRPLWVIFSRKRRPYHPTLPTHLSDGCRELFLCF